MQKVGFVVFFVVMMVTLGLLNRHAYGWFTRAFQPAPWVRRVVFWLLVTSLGGMTFGRVIDWAWTDAPIKWLLFFSGTVQLAVLMSVALLLPVDLARAGANLVRRFTKRPAAPADVTATVEAKADVVRSAEVPATREAEPQREAAAAPAGVLIPRRVLLTQAAAGTAFLIGSSSSLYGAFVGRHDYEIEDVPVRIPGLSRELDGFTIVQLSDVHVGHFTAGPELAAAEALVRRAKPDLVVLTGDLLDHDAELADRLGAFTRRLVPLARYGVTAISGNHDFYAGIGPFVRALTASGVTVLRNQGQVVGSGNGRFALLGVDDVWARRRSGGPDLERAVASLPDVQGSAAKARDLPRILLCHNPSYFEDAAGHVALQLSGHTHGGQVNLVVNPAEWFVKRGWVRGRYEHKGSQLYVNRGFGTVGPPARVGSPPEVTRIVLTA